MPIGYFSKQNCQNLCCQGTSFQWKKRKMESTWMLMGVRKPRFDSYFTKVTQDFVLKNVREDSSETS